MKSHGNGVSKVLKYFRQKKVSSVQEDEHHRFRILHNRLLQWRFVNARGEAAMVNVKKASEMNLFNVCLRILMLRKRILEKKMERQKVKHGMKIHQLVNPQVCLLNEWEKMETKYEQHINRLIRKLSALSICLPFLDIKVDVDSLHQAMKAALEIMESIDPLITRYQSQVERILYQVTELNTISKQQEEYFQELLRIIHIISTSVENEKSMVALLIQANTKLISIKRGADMSDLS
ncbi:QWRF motif-containing protein 7 [Prosopis cineraria]|uniref:QWRF motif-containing protein 7 n=1 Tax=Prosopis cineraria TaxID=364024 RepID=UPI0024100A66|nr:QWRF motif-containing protein 7 [Prosopis cineraria]